MKILIINGVNLNMLGMRDEKFYGSKSLGEINDGISAFCKREGIECEFFQSNIEGEIVNAIQNAVKTNKSDGIVINAGAYTHYSHAIADALECVKIPKIEVHLSNTHAREEFRHTSVLARACNGMICGLGIHSYQLACLAVKNILQDTKK